jgi:hypothetical protein
VGVPEVNEEKRRVRIAAVGGALCPLAGLALLLAFAGTHQAVLAFLAGLGLGTGFSVVLVLTVYYTGEHRGHQS